LKRHVLNEVGCFHQIAGASWKTARGPLAKRGQVRFKQLLQRALIAAASPQQEFGSSIGKVLQHRPPYLGRA
jgi:hypothetical protein